MKSPLGLQADLPVVDIVRESIGLLWQKKEAVVRMFFPAVALLALVDWAGSEFFAEDALTARIIFFVTSMVLGVMFATATHRFTLLAPEHWDSNAVHGWTKTEFRYLGQAALIGIIGGFLIVVLMMVLSLLLGKDGIVVAVVAAILPALYVMSRLSITLPEVAIGQPSSPGRAWQMSAGNGSRLVLVVIIIPLLLMSPFLVLYALDSTLLNYIAAFGSYITTLISLVMLSVSYRFLLEFYERNTPPGNGREEQDSTDDSNTTGFDA